MHHLFHQKRDNLKYGLFLILFSIIQFNLNAQELKIIHVNFSLPETGKNLTSIDNCKFYISDVHLLKSNQTVFNEENSFHLIDLLKENYSFSFKLPPTVDFDQIQFTLSIDSLTNVSGALDGDLDPTKGMYWAWQSGYINFKLEGQDPQSPARDNQFQFHLGGYLPPFLAAQKITMNCKSLDVISIEFDAYEFLKTIDLSELNTVMSPGQNAVDLSKQCALYFSIIE